MWNFCGCKFHTTYWKAILNNGLILKPHFSNRFTWFHFLGLINKRFHGFGSCFTFSRSDVPHISACFSAKLSLLLHVGCLSRFAVTALCHMTWFCSPHWMLDILPLKPNKDWQRTAYVIRKTSWIFFDDWPSIRWWWCCWFRAFTMETTW